MKIISCLLLTAACSGSAGDSWPMFHGEPQLRGVSSSRLAAAYELAWRFETGDAVKSSPVVANGVVCFGSLDTFVYAVSLAAGGNRIKEKRAGKRNLL